MANVTVSLPDELKKKMSAFDYVNWSAVIRSVIEDKMHDFELVDNLAKKSRLTQVDLDKLKPLIDEDIRREVRRLLHEAHRRR